MAGVWIEVAEQKLSKPVDMWFRHFIVVIPMVADMRIRSGNVKSWAREQGRDKVVQACCNCGRRYGLK